MDSLETWARLNDTSFEVNQLLETLQKEGARRRYLTRCLKWSSGLIFAIIAVECLYEYSRGKPVDFGNFAFWTVFWGGTCAYGLTPGLRQAVTEAAALSDKRLLGAMIESLDSGDPKLRDSLEVSSTILLETVNEDDLGLLDEYQLGQLVKAVRISKNDQFCGAALTALPHLGRRRTLQDLEVFLNDPLIPSQYRSNLEPQIRSSLAELRIRLAKA